MSILRFQSSTESLYTDTESIEAVKSIARSNDYLLILKSGKEFVFHTPTLPTLMNKLGWQQYD